MATGQVAVALASAVGHLRHHRRDDYMGHTHAHNPKVFGSPFRQVQNPVVAGHAIIHRHDDGAVLIRQRYPHLRAERDGVGGSRHTAACKHRARAGAAHAWAWRIPGGGAGNFWSGIDQLRRGCWCHGLGRRGQGQAGLHGRGGVAGTGRQRGCHQ